MSSIEKLAEQITVLRKRQKETRDRFPDSMDLNAFVEDLRSIANQAHQIAAQLRHLGAHDYARNAETGWSLPDEPSEDHYDRWCEEQRATYACRSLGLECGFCDTCRENGLPIYP